MISSHQLHLVHGSFEIYMNPFFFIFYFTSLRFAAERQEKAQHGSTEHTLQPAIKLLMWFFIVFGNLTSERLFLHVQVLIGT